jgi:beta-ureidopropionase / N-carbamoyl-L-amino-acid hydrolase
MPTIDRRTFVRVAAGALTAATASLGRARPARGAVPEASGRTWRVDGARLGRRLQDLSRFGANPQGGVSRVAFSPADVEGRAFTMEMMRAAKLEVRVDPVGNIFGRRPGLDAGAAPILFGSHIDSVPEGGNYDGDVGSMSAIEVAQVLEEKGYRNRHPLDVVIWCDEESGLTGSRGFVGDIAPEELERPARNGTVMAENIRRLGGDPARLAEARHEKGSVAAYLELHIEQGGTLDAAGVPIGVVEGIVGIHHYEVTVRGFANHAGTTPMDKRRNALLAASEIVLAVDRIVRAVPGRQVGTVGRLSVRPGAPNVIPGEVSFTVELRDLRTETIESLWAAIEAEARALVARQGCTMEFVLRPPDRPALSDGRVRAIVAAAADELGLRHLSLPSGAGHDAQELARIAPMGMIFVPSVGGISHSPKELSRPEEIANGANVLLQAVLRVDQGALEAGS